MLDVMRRRGRLLRNALRAHFASLCFLVLCTALLLLNGLGTPPAWLLVLPLAFFLAGIAAFLGRAVRDAGAAPGDQALSVATER